MCLAFSCLLKVSCIVMTEGGTEYKLQAKCTEYHHEATW